MFYVFKTFGYNWFGLVGLGYFRILSLQWPNQKYIERKRQTALIKNRASKRKEQKRHKEKDIDRREKRQIQKERNIGRQKEELNISNICQLS